MLLPCKSLLQIWSIGWEVFGETLSWWTPTRTTTNWPLIILAWFATPFSRNECMLTIVPWYLHLNRSKHVLRNVSRLRLHAHTLKVEAAAWLEDGFRVCDHTNVLMNMFKTRCMLFYFAKTIGLMSWGNIFLSVYTFSWGFLSSPTLFAATGQQPTCSWFPFSAEH